MKIALIAAGAGGMYCGSCLRDNTLARALNGAGHEAVLIPTYTPLRTDEPDASIGEVFYGGINVYLQQVSPLFRYTPRWFDKFFDAIPLLRAVTRRAGDANPRKLARLTESILRGEEGRQRKELGRLIGFLHETIRPEIVNLPDEFFLGMAGPMRRELGVPVVCSLTGGDVFLDEMKPRDRERIKELVRARAGDVDCFIATSEFYANYMAEYYRLPRERIRVAPVGIDLAGFDVPAGGRSATSPYQGGSPAEVGPTSFAQTPIIGYLARVCPQKGLHILAEAFIELRRTLNADCRLRAAGYLPGRQQGYLTAIRGRLAEAGCARAFEYVGEPDRAGKIAFLRSLTLFCVPTEFLEPKGIYALEAMAAGVPVVLPGHGVFPEMIVGTGGGVLVTPHDPTALARALAELLANPERRAQLAARGATAVRADRTAATMARRTLEIYEEVLRGGERGSSKREEVPDGRVPT